MQSNNQDMNEISMGLGGKIFWLKWRNVCNPKEKGRLGIKDIEVSLNRD